MQDRVAHLRRRLTMAVIVASSMLAAPLVASAQKTYRIGYLSIRPALVDQDRAFVKGLRELGYVEGRNLVIDWRFFKGKPESLREAAAELAASKPDCIVTVGISATRAAKEATSGLPIVMANASDDPVRHGLVATLARPGGNVTGFIDISSDITGKRLELLKETLGKVTRVAVLWDRKGPGSIPQWNESQQPARDLGLQLYSMEVSSADGYEPAFKEAVKARNQAVWVTLNPLANSNQKRIADLAIEHRLPSICAREDYADNGCLMAYGPGYANEGRDGARYVEKILKGVKPAQIPVEQPMKFDLVINLKTAKQVGVAIPPNVLARADKVIK